MGGSSLAGDSLAFGFVSFFLAAPSGASAGGTSAGEVAPPPATQLGPRCRRCTYTPMLGLFLRLPAPCFPCSSASPQRPLLLAQPCGCEQPALKDPAWALRALSMHALCVEASVNAPAATTRAGAMAPGGETLRHRLPCHHAVDPHLYENLCRAGPTGHVLCGEGGLRPRGLQGPAMGLYMHRKGPAMGLFQQATCVSNS